jgi:hypothetical protein
VNHEIENARIGNLGIVHLNLVCLAARTRRYRGECEHHNGQANESQCSPEKYRGDSDSANLNAR